MTRFAVAGAWGLERVMTVMGFKKTPGDDKNTLYLDCDSSYTTVYNCQNPIKLYPLNV